MTLIFFIFAIWNFRNKLARLYFNKVYLMSFMYSLLLNTDYNKHMTYLLCSRASSLTGKRAGNFSQSIYGFPSGWVGSPWDGENLIYLGVSLRCVRKASWEVEHALKQERVGMWPRGREEDAEKKGNSSITNKSCWENWQMLLRETLRVSHHMLKSGKYLENT